MLQSTRRARVLQARFRSASWRDLAVLAAALLALTGVAAWATVKLVRPAPPSVLTLSTGPEGSATQRVAERYRAAFEAREVTLLLEPSRGSQENLARLRDPRGLVEVAFVQVGTAAAAPAEAGTTELVSLGTVARQPLYILAPKGRGFDRLGALAGKRVAVGAEGSGARALALRLLKANGIEPGGATAFLDVDDDRVGAALEQGEVDAAFLMADAASPRVIRALVQDGKVEVVQLAQLEAYLRRFQDLDRVVIPRGGFDLGKDLPAKDLELLAATVEVVARADLHPAMSDLLIETMKAVHVRATLLQKAGEFPAPREHDLPLSDDAKRYYETGKRFFYRVLPFWAASLTDRFLVALVPLFLLLIPGLRLLPVLWRWRVRQRLYRVYAELLELERDVLAHRTEGKEALEARLALVEGKAEALRLPLSYVDQFYVLREHIGMVRRRLGG